MARHASTYRQARREVFAFIRRSGSPMTWEQANAKMKEGPYDGRFGPVRSEYVGSPLDRSKYIPHIGAKQRAKGAKSVSLIDGMSDEEFSRDNSADNPNVGKLRRSKAKEDKQNG